MLIHANRGWGSGSLQQTRSGKSLRFPNIHLASIILNHRFWEVPLSVADGKSLAVVAPEEKEPELWPKSFFCNGWLLVNNAGWPREVDMVQIGWIGGPICLCHHKSR